MPRGGAYGVVARREPSDEPASTTPRATSPFDDGEQQHLDPGLTQRDPGSVVATCHLTDRHAWPQSIVRSGMEGHLLRTQLPCSRDLLHNNLVEHTTTHREVGVGQAGVSRFQSSRDAVRPAAMTSVRSQLVLSSLGKRVASTLAGRPTVVPCCPPVRLVRTTSRFTRSEACPSPARPCPRLATGCRARRPHQLPPR